jgi:hypothetical protein
MHVNRRERVSTIFTYLQIAPRLDCPSREDFLNMFFNNIRSHNLQAFQGHDVATCRQGRAARAAAAKAFIWQRNAKLTKQIYDEICSYLASQHWAKPRASLAGNR